MRYLGDFFEDSTLQVSFTTNDAAGGAIAPSDAFEIADVKIYKNGSDVQKLTSNGLTMASPFDSITGQHQLNIDTSIDTGDVGFWAIGSDYKVVLDPDTETVDGQTVTAVLATFSIENRNMRGTDNAATAAALAAHDAKLDIVDSNVDEILAQVTGTGNRLITINVKDNLGNNWQDVLVRIGNASQYTGVNGDTLPFALNDGDYSVILRTPYGIFTVPEPLTVAGDGTHPYVGTLITPSLPVQPGTCVVYGVVIDDGGFPVEGAETFINETDISTFANTQKVVKNRRATSDVNGFWELEIVRSSQLTPAGSPYAVIQTYPGFRWDTTATVPDLNSVEFSTIAGT